MKRVILNLILLSVISFFSSNVEAQKNDTSKVFVFKIDEEIAPPVVRRMDKAFSEAKNNMSDLILIHMNTYGGMVESADTIRTRILNSKIPVVVFIDNNAASAGALISIACDSIYMRSGANIGAATVVNQSAEVMPDKYQSYMRATMRSTAEAKGRDPKIAEAMVDQDIYIKDITDSGKVLTFTTSEAIINGFCEAEVSSIEEVLERYGFRTYKIQTLELKATDNIIDFLISPYIHGLLIMIIVGGIYFELQTPGLGFPSIASLAAAVLYFAPLYIEGLAENWEVLIFFAGIILVALEVFVIPGFGIAGVSGIILIILGLVLSLLNNVAFDFSLVTFNAIMEAIFVVVIAIFGAIILSFVGIKHILTNKRFGIALTAKLSSSEGNVASGIDLKEYFGMEAVAYTILRPSGKIELNYEIFDAVAEESFVEKGQKVKIIGKSNNQLVVRKI